MELIQLLREMRKEKRQLRIKPELLLLTEIKKRYGKDPLPELRQLWADGLVKNCRTLNGLAFIYNGE